MHSARLHASKPFIIAMLLGILAGCDVPSATGVATAAVAEAATPLETGSLDAVLEYRAPPAKSAPRVAKGEPRPEPKPKLEPKPDPKPTGPSAELLAAQAELARIQGDTATIAAAEAALRAATAEAAAANAPIAAELAAVSRKIQEVALSMEIESAQVRQNKCCSVCGNSKTEIERNGEPFDKHLTNVKGTIAVCKPGKLEAVQRKYAGQLEPLKQRAAELRAKVGPASQAAQAKVNAALAAVDAAKVDRAQKLAAAQAKLDAAAHK